jgi:hypothetical protein
MFSCNLLLLILWTVLDPLYWSRVTVSETETYGHCSASDNNAWKSLLIVLGLVNGLALVLANVEAYKARAITTEYGESKYIAMIMASILQVIVVGMPLLFLVDDNPTASYFIRSSIVFVICMSILLMMFVPKIYTWTKKKDARRVGLQRQGGLRFQVYDSPELVAERAAKLDDYMAKVEALEKVMLERGYEAKVLFKEVGLTDMSTVEPSRYQSYANISSASRGDVLSSIVVEDNEQPIVHSEKTEKLSENSSLFMTPEEKDEGPLHVDKKITEETVMSDILEEEKEERSQHTEAGPDLESNHSSPSLPQAVISSVEFHPFDESSSRTLTGEGVGPDLEDDFGSPSLPPPVLM